jgi:copper chaperone
MTREQTMNRTTLTIEGMSCGHCVGAVRQALGRVAGVQVEQVEIGSARVAYDPERTRPEELREVVEEEGYRVRGMESEG